MSASPVRLKLLIGRKWVSCLKIFGFSEKIVECSNGTFVQIFPVQKIFAQGGFRILYTIWEDNQSKKNWYMHFGVFDFGKQCIANTFGWYIIEKLLSFWEGITKRLNSCFFENFKFFAKCGGITIFFGVGLLKNCDPVRKDISKVVAACVLEKFWMYKQSTRVSYFVENFLFKNA